MFLSPLMKRSPLFDFLFSFCEKGHSHEIKKLNVEIIIFLCAEGVPKAISS